MPLSERKAKGVYFTPRPFRQRLLDLMIAHSGGNIPSKILEPSFGSGEFMLDIAERLAEGGMDDGSVRIKGVELNATFVKEVAKLAMPMQLDLVQGDFLSVEPTAAEQKAMDWVIGNPPYYIPDKAAIPQAYAPFLKYQTNLYSLFIVRAVDAWLKPDGGILGFIIPCNFLTTSLYEPIRRWLLERVEILAIEKMGNARYTETNQETVMFLASRRACRCRKDAQFIRYTGGNVIFTMAEEAEERSSEADAFPVRTLASLGFIVRTGYVIWNRVRENLREKGAEGAVPLVYAMCLESDGGVSIPDKMSGDKKPYIALSGTKEPLRGPLILVNRGYGTGPYKMRFAVVEDLIDGLPFYVENHVNVILPQTEAARRLIPAVATVLRSAATRDFIQRHSSNGAFSKTQLETVLPIHIVES